MFLLNIGSELALSQVEANLQYKMFLLNSNAEETKSRMNHLQYKMFLLNAHFVKKDYIDNAFTIQNVSIKSYLPQTTYTVYHFSSFLSIPIFSYIFIKNSFLFFR